MGEVNAHDRSYVMEWNGVASGTLVLCDADLSATSKSRTSVMSCDERRSASLHSRIAVKPLFVTVATRVYVSPAMVGAMRCGAVWCYQVWRGVSSRLVSCDHTSGREW